MGPGSPPGRSAPVSAARSYTRPLGPATQRVAAPAALVETAGGPNSVNSGRVRVQSTVPVAAFSAVRPAPAVMNAAGVRPPAAPLFVTQPSEISTEDTIAGSRAGPAQAGVPSARWSASTSVGPPRGCS